MTWKNSKWGLAIILLALFMAGATPAHGGALIAGSTVGSMDATLGGIPLLPGTTLYSGDTLKVGEGDAEVAVGDGSRIAFGAQTDVSFERGPQGVTVTLGRGNILFYHAPKTAALQVKSGDIAVLPTEEFETEGEVAALDGAWQVTSRRGTLRVVGPERSVEVTKGKTLTISRRLAASPSSLGGPAASGVKLGKGLVAVFGAAGSAGVAAAVRPKNPNAVGHVAAHVPTQACQHAASPSVPAQACQ